MSAAFDFEPEQPAEVTEVNVGAKRKKLEVNFDDQVKTVVGYVQGKVGIAETLIATLIVAIIPRMTNWFSKCTGNDDPAPVAAKAYNAATDSFDPEVIRKMRPQARRGCRSKGERHVSTEDLDQISIGLLRHAMTQEQDTTAAVFAMCHEPD